MTIEEMREELLNLGSVESLHCAGCGMEAAYFISKGVESSPDDAPIVLLKALLGILTPFAVAVVHGHLFSHGLNSLGHPTTTLNGAALSGLGDFLKIAQLDMKAVVGDNQ